MNVVAKSAAASTDMFGNQKPNWHKLVLQDLGYQSSSTKSKNPAIRKMLEGGCVLYEPNFVNWLPGRREV